MARMHEERYPHQALFSWLCVAKHSKGHLAQSFVSIMCKDVQVVGIPSAQGGWYEHAQDRPQWWANIKELPASRCPLGNNLLDLIDCKLEHKLPL
jgi:hypothetical protein